jgi:hypothetical protein
MDYPRVRRAAIARSMRSGRRGASTSARTFFKHVKGEKGGQPLYLEDHGRRRSSPTCSAGSDRTNCGAIARLWEMARGNGKSTECVVIAGILLYLDDEPGADISRPPAHAIRPAKCLGRSSTTSWITRRWRSLAVLPERRRAAR